MRIVQCKLFPLHICQSKPTLHQTRKCDPSYYWQGKVLFAKPSANCCYSNQTKGIHSIQYQNHSFEYLINASQPHNLLSTLNHIPAEMTTWRPPKNCIPTIHHRLLLQKNHYEIITKF